MTTHERNSSAVTLTRRLKAYGLIPRNDFAVCVPTHNKADKIRWYVVNTTTDLRYPVTGYASVTDTAKSVKWEITTDGDMTYVNPEKGNLE
jgi:hypothetical protein